MANFWDFSIWGIILLFGILLGSLLAGNVVKKSMPFLRDSLIPTSVLGFPMMFLATLAPAKPILTLIIFAVFCAVLNLFLFRSKIFRSRRRK